MWDHAGSGREADSPVLVEDEVIGKLVSRGWSRERLAAIAVVPELEATLSKAIQRNSCMVSFRC